MVGFKDFLIYPSFYSLVFGGIILLIVFVLFFKNYKTIVNLGIYQLISLLCVISIAIGNHGVLHALFETKNKPNLNLLSLHI